MATEPIFPSVPEPDPPSAEEVERMRAHRRDEHGEDFDLRRDVSYAGNASGTAPMTYAAATPAGPAAYHCNDCPGRRFTLDDPYIGTPERRAHLRRVDPQLRTLLANVNPADQDRFIDRYARRRLGALAPVQAEPATRHRRETVQRIADCNEFVHGRRMAGRTMDEAISDLTDLQQTNPKRYREIVGTNRLYEAETFRDYYKQTLPRRRNSPARPAGGCARAAR